MRTQFSVVVERTVNELNGIACLTWSDVIKSKVEIFSTRSFGERVTNYHSLKAALSTHGSIVCRKARLQGSLIKKLRVFVASSPHDENYYQNSFLCEVPIATDNTLTIIALISNALDQIFVAGIRYYRCGVGAVEMTSDEFSQQDLFMTNNNNPELMRCYDHINKRWGNDSLKVAVEGASDKWQMKREFLSPSYTSKWRDIPKIEC